ncbi:MFS transporter [Caulobacter sp. DWP3-1-3b2]|uniref:MFS transporter n=1 Tax=Caulobacter sp. DWP3-1-3b2 TaxID=2804643 RepID=UPI003CF75CE1
MKKATVRPNTLDMIFYGAGEGATSLVLNGLYGFALIFYTEALGLSPVLAGLALSISIFWEAITEPYMGYLSDRTRSRFGSRYPWIFIGAIALALCFYFLWKVPAPLRGGGTATFAYLVVLNLLLRTSLTMFIVPYLALGFEVAPSYGDRPKLQGIRWVCNMAANMAGPAMAWILFFNDTTGADGKILKGTSVASNFEAMGGAFSIALLGLTALMLWGCRWAAKDTRLGQPNAPKASNVGFWEGFKPIISDRDVRSVIGLIFLLVTGMVIVSSLQIYLYVHFMVFSAGDKTIVHGSTMVAAALGALISPWAAKRFDKKGAVVFGSIIGIVGELGLALAFLTGWLPRSGALAVSVFILFQGFYWLASGVVLPVVTAMMADVADLGGRRAGRTLDGSYSAVLSLAWRVGTSLSLLLSGLLLGMTGFETVVGSEPSPQSVWRVAGLVFAVGAVFYGLSIAWVRSYRLDRVRFSQLVQETP